MVRGGGLEEMFFSGGLTFKKKGQDHKDMQSFKLTEDDEYECKYKNNANETIFNVFRKNQQRKQKQREDREDIMVINYIHAIFFNYN